MFISVIVPTYKPQKYLWECLSSLDKQTFSHSDFEVILVLNGCNEPYSSQIRTWISEHQLNINFIQLDQGGVSNARNVALGVAKGEYITFIDDDDFVSSSYLELLYKKASIETISIAYPYAFCEENQEQIKYRLTDVFEKYVFNDNLSFLQVKSFFSGPWMKLIHRDIINNRRFNPQFSIGEDSLFNYAISDKYGKMIFADKEAIYYRRYRGGSALLSHRTKLDIIQNGLRLQYAVLSIFFSNLFNYDLNITLSYLWSIMKGTVFNIFFKIK